MNPLHADAMATASMRALLLFGLDKRLDSSSVMWSEFI